VLKAGMAYDLEKILDGQETHDLYCPNCKSRITRRVILKKRKRTTRQAKRDEPPKSTQHKSLLPMFQAKLSLKAMTKCHLKYLDVYHASLSSFQQVLFNLPSCTIVSSSSELTT
jgi:hypothetical protein